MAINIRKDNQLSQMSALMSNKSIKSIYVKIDNESTCIWGDDLADSLFTYTIQNNSVTITGLNPNNQFSGNLSIPNRIKGVPVTAIGSSSFKNNKNIMGITIGSNIIGVSDNAFDGCTSLTSITVAEGNTKYHSSGNCLIETASNTLVLGCKTSVIPSDGSVIYIGKYAFKGCTGLASITIPDSVTSIGSSAFSGCSGLASITIPDGVTSIGLSAFSGCSSLESITIPFVGAKAGVTSSDTYQYPFGYIFGTSSYDGGVATKQYYYGNSTSSTTSTTYYIPSSLKSVTVTGGNILYGAFYGCTGLASITIGSGVTGIVSSAFEECTGLAIVNWNATECTSAGSYSNPIFKGCSNLETVNIGENVKIIPSYAFSGCTRLTSVTIPDSVTSIGTGAFYDCSGLASITIPDGVTSIGSYAFSGCSGLTSVTIPDSVTSIGDSAFIGCSGLTSVTLGNGVKSIGYRAFLRCTRLTSVTIPDSVTTIAVEAFSYCTGLTDITVANGNTKYHSEGNCLIETATKTLILGCKTSVIPTDGSVTSIGDGAFYGCSGITSVTIPDSVTSIGNAAFSGCSGLTSITIPDGVTSIGTGAFYDCSGLTSITFNGTKAQWRAITKGFNWNSYTGKYTIHCTDGDISK